MTFQNYSAVLCGYFAFLSGKNNVLIKYERNKYLFSPVKLQKRLSSAKLND